MKSVLTSAILATSISLASASFAAPSDRNDTDWSSDGQSKAYQLALAAIDKQDYSDAIGHLDGLVSEQPENADAYNMLGFSHRKMKNYETAERYYNKALALDPEHRGALNYLGRLYVETNRSGKAKELLKRLDDTCWLGCKEFDDLKAAIETTSN